MTDPLGKAAYANTAQGEAAERAEILGAALESDYRPKVGEGEYDYLALTALPKALREQAKDALFCDADPHVTIDAWNIVQMAADELEAALANQQGEGQTAGSGLLDASPAALAADLAALSAPEDTPKPQPAEVEQVGDGALRDDLRDSIITWFENRTGFHERDGDGVLSAYYGGYWISFDAGKLAQHLAALPRSGREG